MNKAFSLFLMVALILGASLGGAFAGGVALGKTQGEPPCEVRSSGSFSQGREGGPAVTGGRGAAKAPAPEGIKGSVNGDRRPVVGSGWRRPAGFRRRSPGWTWRRCRRRRTGSWWSYRKHGRKHFDRRHAPGTGNGNNRRRHRRAKNRRRLLGRPGKRRSDPGDRPEGRRGNRQGHIHHPDTGRRSGIIWTPGAETRALTPVRRAVPRRILLNFLGYLIGIQRHV